MRAAAAASLLLSAPTFGEQPAERSPLGVVSLQAQASREVTNDQLTASLAAEANGQDAAALAETVNRAMTEALAAAKAYPSVTVRSGRYQTHPLYKDGRIASWRVSQELRLEARDFASAARLIGRLQQTLVVRQLTVGLSPEVRQATEDALIGEAIQAFHRRAGLVSEAMKATGYRVRQLDLGGAGGQPVMLAAAGARAQTPPPLEPGNSLVTVHLSGSILLNQP